MPLIASDASRLSLNRTNPNPRDSKTKLLSMLNRIIGGHRSENVSGLTSGGSITRNVCITNFAISFKLSSQYVCRCSFLEWISAQPGNPGRYTKIFIHSYKKDCRLWGRPFRRYWVVHVTYCGFYKTGYNAPSRQVFMDRQHNPNLYRQDQTLA